MIKKTLTFDIENYHLVEEKFKTLPKDKNIQKTVKNFLLDLMNDSKLKISRFASCNFHFTISDIKMQISIIHFANSISVSFIDNDIHYKLLNINMNVKDLSKLVKPMYMFLYAYTFDDSLFTTRVLKEI